MNMMSDRLFWTATAKPEIPEWAKAENMEMSFSQADLWKLGRKSRDKAETD